MKNERAFSLLEVLVVTLLSSVIVMAVSGALSTGNMIYNKDAALLDMEAQSRNAIDRIVREVRYASAQTITKNYNGTTNDKIVFTTPLSVGVQYYLSGTRLVREYPSGSSTVLAGNIDLLKFSLTGSLLLVQVRASQTSFNQLVSVPLTVAVRLRNE